MAVAEKLRRVPSNNLLTLDTRRRLDFAVIPVHHEMQSAETFSRTSVTQYEYGTGMQALIRYMHMSTSAPYLGFLCISVSRFFLVPYVA